MALIETLNITGNDRVFVKCKNKRNGTPETYTVLVDGSFGSGTITAQVSADGSNWLDITETGSPVTFAADGVKNFELYSDENNPIRLGFNMSGSTSPDVNISVYSNA